MPAPAHSAPSDERPFDVIPYEDIRGDWKKLGSGSFGNVYKGKYLGIDVAIKEVLPSSDYDVAKYFEREWRLMKECRHPNVVLYLGLSRAPEPDNRIFIISEFIENGNLRQYIHDKSRPFPWRVRISFATDIVRALAYLHARKCIHRDLKGENLLVTSNGRLKITDFGFARIAARNAEESKRLTFCGTDAYMSPEIMLGLEFGLATDVFSLGIIFCEIAARKLADEYTFKRVAPRFEIDTEEVKRKVNSGCPEDFTKLALDCLAEEPSQRPDVLTILARLAVIEAEVFNRPEEAEDAHVGSVKFMGGGKRPGMAPRIPSFGMGVGKHLKTNGRNPSSGSSEDSEDEEEVIEALKDVHVGLDNASQQPLLASKNAHGDYSTSVIRTHSPQGSHIRPPSLSSILTIRSPQPTVDQEVMPTVASMISIDSFHTASSSVSIAAATEGTEGRSTIRTRDGVSSSALIHRFSLIKPGGKRQGPSARVGSPTRERARGGITDEEAGGVGSGVGNGHVETGQRSPFGFFFSSGLAAKCDICSKRLGWKPVLECDDCGLRAHTKCGDLAPMDCGLRPPRPRVPQTITLLAGSPLSKTKIGKAVVGGSPASTPKKGV